MKPAAMLAAALLLAGCAVRPIGGDEPPVGPGRATRDSRTAVTLPGVVAQPPGAVALVRERDGFRVAATTGQLGSARWAGPDLLLVDWFPGGSGSQPTTLMLVNLGSETVHDLLTADSVTEFISPGGQYLAQLWRGDSSRSIGVAVANVTTGDQQAAYAVDPQLPQWSVTGDSRWSFAGPPANLYAMWVAPDRFVVTVQPQDVMTYRWNWGQVLLVNVSTQQVHALAAQGQLAAALPDGAVLIRLGWADGDLVLYDRPGASPRTVATNPDRWTWGWAVRPDGEQVAWLELDPPPGDWRLRLPQGCCSGEPAPLVAAITIWDRTADVVRRTPVIGAVWDQDLRWRRDGSGVLFAGVPAPGETGLYLLTGDGQVILLARHPWEGQIQVHAEGADGSIYYTLSARLGETWAARVRRHPDGRSEVLREGIPDESWAVDDTGNPAAAPAADISPGGRWTLAYERSLTDLTVRRAGP